MCTCVGVDVVSFVSAIRWRELPRVGEGGPMCVDLVLCVSCFLMCSSFHTHLSLAAQPAYLHRK